MITINMDKAKAIGHDKRRAMRAEEFKPYDEVCQVFEGLLYNQIP